MDFGFSAEQELFRQQVRGLLAEEPVQAQLAALRAQPSVEPDARPLYRELGRRGLLGVSWPVEYGGDDRSLIEASITAEELVRAGVPDTLYVNTVQIVGLFLLVAGTHEQKARYLPPIARGESFASVLYTEPDSGSDLGSLRATARREEGGWRLSGAKLFSMKSQFTDLGLCAARTGAPDSQHQGISLFLVDLHAEGMRRETIPSIANEQFHRLELDHVRVPDRDLLGEVDKGWPLLWQALAMERTGLDYSLKAESWLDAAMQVLDATAEIPEAVLEELGRHCAEMEASRLLSWRVLTGLMDGRIDEAGAAGAKFYTSELAQRVALWGATRLGGEPDAPAAAVRTLEAAFREGPGLTLSAGTSEMMLQIVASLALDDLEREVRAG